MKSCVVKLGTLLAILASATVVATRAVASEPTLILDVRAGVVWRVDANGAVSSLIEFPDQARVAYGADRKWVALNLWIPKIGSTNSENRSDYDLFVNVYDTGNGHEVASQRLEEWRIATTHASAEDAIHVHSDRATVMYLTQDPPPDSIHRLYSQLHVWDVAGGSTAEYPIHDDIYGFRPSVFADHIFIHWLNGSLLRRLDDKTITPFISMRAFREPWNPGQNRNEGFWNMLKGDEMHFFYAAGHGILWTDGIRRFCYVADRDLKALPSPRPIESKRPFCDLQLAARGGETAIVYGQQTGEHYFDTLIFRDIGTGEVVFSRSLPFRGYFLKASGARPLLRMFNGDSGALVEYDIDRDEIRVIASFGRASEVRRWAEGRDPRPATLEFHEALKILGTF